MPTVLKSGSLNLLEPSGPVQSCNGIALLYKNQKNIQFMVIAAPRSLTLTSYQVIYRVSQEECVRLRESVPYVKVYRYNPKHLYPKLNGYGDNGQRKVWSSCSSTYCTCSADALRVYQNAQSAKLNQYFNTAGYSCDM